MQICYGYRGAWNLFISLGPKSISLHVNVSFEYANIRNDWQVIRPGKVRAATFMTSVNVDNRGEV